MKILVANLGSTSFKYRLFDMADERQLARGGVERIGSPESPCFVEIGGKRQELTAQVPDHAAAVRQCLAQLTDPRRGCLQGRERSGGDRLQGGARRPGQRRAAGDARRAGGDGRNEPGRAGPQSALHQGDAAAGREAAGDSAGGGVRDGLSRDDRRPAAVLRRAVRVGREAAHQALGLPRREPSLHRPADEPAARPLRSADHLVPPRRLATACARFAGSRAWRRRWA